MHFLANSSVSAFVWSKVDGSKSFPISNTAKNGDGTAAKLLSCIELCLVTLQASESHTRKVEQRVGYVRLVAPAIAMRHGTVIFEPLMGVISKGSG